MSDFPFCEICKELIKQDQKALELYCGTANGKGFFRNILGRLLKKNVSLATAHVSCVHEDMVDKGRNEHSGVIATKTFWDSAGVTLAKKEDVNHD